ncbi:HpcH/HpaI aldolase/citrate lyase family protein [uncultured Faecalibaculum sp.]|nr:aldolase/citrate lyase family protein [Faecalibaculum rodentium]
MKQDPAVGLLVKVCDSPAMVHIAAQCGMDFLFYDLEHGMISDQRLLDLTLLGNALGIPSLVRVPQLARKDVSRTLDEGAAGVMVPMIETPQQARQLADWALYPPLGCRSYSGGANTGYGPGGNHRVNMDKANDSVLVLAQIETVKGVTNCEAILDVPGISGAVIGPCDLSISRNDPDDMMNPEEVAMISRVQKACHERGKLFGLIGPYKLMEQLPEITDLAVAAFDTTLLRNGCLEAVKEFREMNSGRRKETE